MRRLDELHLEHPVYGSRKLTVLLAAGRLAGQSQAGGAVVAADGDRGDLRQTADEPGRGRAIKFIRICWDLEVNGPDQVWCSDITYVPMAQGFMYLVAVMDWWSRYVLAWRLSNTLESGLLCGGLGSGVAGWAASAADLQHRPGVAVHVAAVSGRGGIGRDGGEHGRSRPLDGQSVHRAVVAECQV